MDSKPRTDPYLSLAGIGKTFGSGDQQTQALGRIDLDVRQGEFLAAIALEVASRRDVGQRLVSDRVEVRSCDEED